MEQLQTVTIADFKAHCSEYLEHTKIDHVEYIVTQKGIPVAKLMPLENKEEKRVVSRTDPSFRAGRMKGTFKIIGDIMEPIWPMSDEDDKK